MALFYAALLLIAITREDSFTKALFCNRVVCRTEGNRTTVYLTERQW